MSIFQAYSNIHRYYQSTFQTYNIRNIYKSNIMKIIGIFQTRLKNKY